MTRAAADPHNEVRQVAASSWHTPASVLQTMVNDRSRVVRELLAHNRNSPPQVLEQLAYDATSEVRLCVADRPLSVAALEHLASDLSIDVRERVARRTDLPTHVCLTLAADVNPCVRVQVAQGPAPQTVYEALALDHINEVVRAVAGNPAIGRHVAMTLIGHRDRTVRAALGLKSHDADVLGQLADDPELSVRAAVAVNPALAASTAARMLNSQSALLKRSVLARHHENLPDELVERTVEELLCSPRSDIRTALRRQFRTHIRPRTITSPPALDDRRGLFEVVDQYLPFSLIAEAVTHPSVPVTVRAALLEHHEVPAKLRRQLRNHPHELIRTAANRPRKGTLRP